MRDGEQGQAKADARGVAETFHCVSWSGVAGEIIGDPAVFGRRDLSPDLNGNGR